MTKLTVTFHKFATAPTMVETLLQIYLLASACV